MVKKPKRRKPVEERWTDEKHRRMRRLLTLKAVGGLTRQQYRELLELWAEHKRKE